MSPQLVRGAGRAVLYHEEVTLVWFVEGGGNPGLLSLMGGDRLLPFRDAGPPLPATGFTSPAVSHDPRPIQVVDDPLRWARTASSGANCDIVIRSVCHEISLIIEQLSGRSIRGSQIRPVLGEGKPPN